MDVNAMNKAQALEVELRRRPESARLSTEQRQQIVQAAVPHLRVGNYDEALDKAHRDVLYGGRISFR